MCLAAVAIGMHRRFPLVLVSNRDEFYERPTAALGWWPAEPGRSRVLAGRDLRAGGTWLGLNESGRLALVTNLRRPTPTDPGSPSRGGLVLDWLNGDSGPQAFGHYLARTGYQLFNLLAADLTAGHWFWASSECPAGRPLAPGIHAQSNGLLDEDWPKVRRIKQQLAAALREDLGSASEVNRTALEQVLFSALLDQQLAADEDLPDTGIGLERERWLSPVFIRSPQAHYGTRCSTLIITERTASGLQTVVIERSYRPSESGFDDVRVPVDSTAWACAELGIQN